MFLAPFCVLVDSDDASTQNRSYSAVDTLESVNLVVDKSQKKHMLV